MRRSCSLLALCLSACGVLATDGEGARDLPDAQLGPYRKLDELEVALPPFVRIDFAAAVSGPSAVRVGDEIELYTSATLDADGRAVLRRTRSSSPDEFGADVVVLEPEAAEVGLVDPAVVVTSHDTTLLYYGVPSGDRIGLARLEDGSFVRQAPALLATDDEPIGAPSVLEVDGALWMYFARGDHIEHATSADGLSWQEQGTVLAPGEGWDAAAVGDPDAVLYTSPLGRRSVRLYYTGRSSADPPVSAVGVAASFDGRSGFERLVGNPLFSGERDERAPALLALDGTNLLYFAQTSGAGRAGIAGAVDPAEVRF